ncbi:MAG: hypothetical protein H7832_06620 [Magnetococcus sp. DMHC-6]
MQSESAMEQEITFAQAIQEGLRQAMERYPEVMVMGEGVPDPKNIFKTTEGLRALFGGDRVLDMPLAENGMTGVCIGLALSGFRPVLVHQRVDFALLSMDQLINNAAKWHYVFNGQVTVPLVVRLLIGRGWGQGPQHAQSLQALFAHIPGLKVVMPTTPRDAKGMLIRAICDNNPVLFLEHRWLHGLKGRVPMGYYETSLDQAQILRTGGAVTVATFSYMTIEALAVADVLADFGVEVTIIDMRSARPMDMQPVLASLQKTGRLLVLDTGWASCGVSAELLARVVEQGFASLRCPPLRITLPDHPVPTAEYLTNDYYPDGEDILRGILKLVDADRSWPLEALLQRVRLTGHRDVPNPAFVGPF